jgi:hypothetical protein
MLMERLIRQAETRSDLLPPVPAGGKRKRSIEPPDAATYSRANSVLDDLVGTPKGGDDASGIQKDEA